MRKVIKLHDGKFSVEMEEYGRGEPLLFLHGAAGLSGFESFLEELGKDFHVIAPHLPGFGASTGSEQIDDVIIPLDLPCLRDRGHARALRKPADGVQKAPS